ncbi:replication initiation protein [Teichococcus vastitatis]|uniref:Replication protein RepA n=1 Tax=Teichococcus vastitatis TaxID=2307076 RepID=A0ABS9VZ68_9PROT|nr:replication protein RepA [Pseudoroseomonas vastitatis]MCI0752284.1 replication protein RepA [Pseudoroseomonas vastitatis]
MNISVSPADLLNQEQAHSDPGIVWLHPAFCRLGLPLLPAQGAWQREAEGTGVALDAADGQSLPSGWCLRLLLMHFCDSAVRSQDAAVDLGADITALATQLGVPATTPVLDEVRTQLEALLQARLTVAEDAQAPLGVLDARGRGKAAAWRPRIRLNSRFLASLLRQAVPLDRRVVTALAAEPLALDAHGWIRSLRQGQAAGTTITTGWNSLLRRFGAPNQDLPAFRAAFEDALRMVFALDFSISLAADDEGVTVGEAAGSEAPPPAPDVAPPQPALPEAAPPVEEAPRARTPRAAARAVAPPEAPPAAAPAAAAPAAAPPVEAAPASAAASETAAGAPAASAGPRRLDSSVSLRQSLTGLPVVVWLRRGTGEEPLVIGVTPGPRMETDRLTVLMLEPMMMQVSGGLNQREFDQVSAWVATNRDLIDQFWDGEFDTFEEVTGRVRKTPAANWRMA